MKLNNTTRRMKNKFIIKASELRILFDKWHENECQKRNGPDLIHALKYFLNRIKSK